MKRKRGEEIPVPRHITRQTSKMLSVSVNYKEEISDDDESPVEPFIPRRHTIQTPKGASTNYKKKEISDEDELSTSINPEDQLSEYEKKRMENIKKNEEMMIALNLKHVKNELNLLQESNKRRSMDIGFTSKPKQKLNLKPSRRSLRIQTKNTDHPIKFIYEPVISAAEEIERKPSGPLNMVPLNENNEESKTFLTKLLSEKSKVEEDVERLSATRYKERISKLHILPNHVSKIAPKGIRSMTFHPSLTKSILCVGDKGGNIGFWDVDAKGKSSNNGIFVYEPHTSIVATVSFHPDKNNNLYSCSYDGTVRCADFNTCVFDEVYFTDDNTMINGLSYPCSSVDTIILGQSNGKVALVDTREKKSTYTLHQCHIKAIKCVHCSPTNTNLFCTSSADASVALWDIRKIKNIKSKLESVHLRRSVTSAYFSPISGQQILTTSFNDYVEVFELTSSLNLENKKTFKHFNQTGRWITPFKATWDPKHDCGIVIGSMLLRRRVQIYHSEQSQGSPFVQLFDEKYDTITSINVFHNTRNILASGNSSGKVYIWT